MSFPAVYHLQTGLHMLAPYAHGLMYLHITSQTGVGLEDCSVTVAHRFTCCRPCFTMVNIGLLQGKHFRLPDSREHRKLDLVIDTQTGPGVWSQLTMQYEHNAKAYVNWGHLWIVT